MRDLAMVFVWLAIVPLALREPFIGVMMWDWTAFLNPNSFVFGFATTVQFNKIAAGLTGLGFLFSNASKRIHWDGHIIILLLLLLQGTISYLLAPNNISAPDVFDKFWKICALCVLINIVITSRLRLHSMLIITAVALGYYGVSEGFKMILTGGGYHMLGIGSYGDNNQSAIPLLMILPILSYLSRYSKLRIVRYVFLAGTLIDSLGVMSTWSRGAFVGLSILAIAMVLLSKRRLRAGVLVGVAAVAIMSLLSVGYVERLQTIQDASQDDSFMGRVLAWEVSYEMAREHPFFGEGFHAVQDVSIWGDYVQKVPLPEALRGLPPDLAKAAHSIYFEVMGDLGFLGLAIYLLLLLYGFRNTGKVIRFTKRKPDLQWMAEMAMAFRLSLIVFAVTGAAVSVGYFEILYVVLTLAAVLARFSRLLERETAAETERARIANLPFRLNPVGRPVAARVVGEGTS